MPRFQPENRQRDSDLIIEVALIFQHVEPSSQRTCNHILGAGFPYASGDPDKRDAEPVPVVRSKIMECFQRIFDLYDRFPGKLLRIPVRHGRGGAIRKSVRDKIIPVELLALQGNKKTARAYFSR